MRRTYKSPHIEEAICELSFAPTPDVPDIDLTLPGNLQAKLGKELYPGPTRQVVGRTHMLDQRGLQIAPPEVVRVQLPSKDERSIIAIGRDTLSVSRIRPYPGWDTFKPEIGKVLAAWPDVVSRPRICVRVGLRYINRLVATKGRPVDHWLTDVPTSLEAADEDDNAISGTLVAINTQRQFEIDQTTRVNVTLATLEPEAPANAEYLIDIDALAFTVPLDDADQIMATIDRLHTIAGAVFESQITDHTRALLNAT